MQPPLPQAPAAALALQVASIEPAGRQTHIYRLARPDGGQLPPADAGAHLTLVLPLSATLQLQRQYSILHPGVALTEYVIAVKRETSGSGGSAFIHERLRVGDRVDASTPRNNFPLVETAGGSLLIAGGIGVTAMIGMALRLQELQRPYELRVAFRDAEHELLAQELGRLKSVVRHFDAVAGGLFPLSATLAAAPRESHLYCCGPAPMIRAFLAAAAADGRNASLLHVEYFSAVHPESAAGSFVVELARSGRSFVVSPGESILQVLREAGIATLSNCEQGVCGACEVKVLEGLPDHRDAVLSPAERKKNTSMMICCSGSLSEHLVLDL